MPSHSIVSLFSLRFWLLFNNNFNTIIFLLLDNNTIIFLLLDKSWRSFGNFLSSS